MSDPNANGWPKTPGLEIAVARVIRGINASQPQPPPETAIAGDMDDAFVQDLLEIAARLQRHGLTNTAILELLRAALPNPTPKE